jgi:hypothetical protein
MNKPQSITSLPESPDADRHRRMVRYGIAMGIRVLCVIACFFVHGWWLLVPVLGAVVLPYVAVVLANVGTPTGSTVERPGVAPTAAIAPSRRSPREVDQ